MLIDTHCHLDAAEFDADRAVVHARAEDVGVGRLVIPAVAVDGFAKTRSVVAAFSGCVAAYGIHPLYAKSASEADLDVLRAWLVREKPVAVGEIGLDFFVENKDPARQVFFFEKQLALAGEAGLPVLLHVRRAVDAVLKSLRRWRVPGGIAHAFNGSRQQADAFIKQGFVLGFGGAMTFEGSTRIRQLATSLPLDAIVLETDAPDIPPAWLNGGRNEPAVLRRIAEVLAELRGISVDEVMVATTANAIRVLPRLGPRSEFDLG